MEQPDGGPEQRARISGALLLLLEEIDGMGESVAGIYVAEAIAV